MRPLVLTLVLVSSSALMPGLAHPGSSPHKTSRSVAVTFDDLPATRLPTLAAVRVITNRLLDQLRRERIPAIGFVNEAKLEGGTGEKEARTALLEAWLEAGFELGNHTYSHVRLYDTPLADFQADVLRGEQVTRRLMAARGLRPRYFRHPTLNTGPDLQTKSAFERFLSEQGYAVAPVTIDSDEYLYALAYDRAEARGDTTMMKRLGRDYVRYMRQTFGFFEQLSDRLLGREPAQVLLLHANALNAECLDELVAMMRGRGYRFVSLDVALEDLAYRLPDDYIGPRGPSWLVRWAVTQRRTPGDPPSVPAWVQQATR